MATKYARPYILFVHGRDPKPEPGAYRERLWQCMLEGVRRADEAAAEALAGQPECFELVYWSDLFYSRHRDIQQDLPGIERVIRCRQPQPEDVAEARRWGRRWRRCLYGFIDRFPGVMRRFADPWMQETVDDTQRYLEDRNGLATQVRARLKNALQKADMRPLILIGHSLGSVVAYDTLWELTHEAHAPVNVDLFLTLGSPLGTRFIQLGLQGRRYKGLKRYPHGIRHWRNLATVGDLAALDPTIEGDFAEMCTLGLVESLTDNCNRLYNSFKNDAGYNPHRSYGYLVLPAAGRAIASVMARKPHQPGS